MTLSKQDESRLEAMELWIYHCMKKISWIDKKTNKEVLEMMGVEQRLLKTIRQRQLRFVGHIVREESIEKLSLQGGVDGCRGRGRRRQDFLQGLATVAGTEFVEIHRWHKTEMVLGIWLPTSDSDMAHKEAVI